MLANEDELFALVSNPGFVNYSLYAMDSGQVYSVRGVDLLDVIRPQRSRKRRFSHGWNSGQRRGFHFQR